MALRWTPAAAVSAFQIAGQQVAQAITGALQLFSDTAMAAENNRRAIEMLVKRLEDLSGVIREELVSQHEPVGSQAWVSALKTYLAELTAVRALLQERMHGSYTTRLLHKDRDVEQIKAATDRLKDARTVLMTQAHIDIQHAVESPTVAGLSQPQSQARDTDPCVCSGQVARLRIPLRATHHFGRSREVQHAVANIMNGSAAHVAILGGPGMGKTSLALAVLRDPTVEGNFGSHRLFIDCADAAGSTASVLAIICDEIGIPARDQGTQKRQITSTFQSGKWLLVIDHFEFLWDKESSGQNADRMSAAESVLEFLAGFENVSLVVAIRGAERPSGIAWERPLLPPLGPLTASAAIQTFVAISDASETDRDLSLLLANADGIPLAIVLTAYLAQLEPLGELVKRWNEEKTAMLVRGSGKSHSNSLDMSISMSLHSWPLQREPHATELLGMLALLPLGAVATDIRIWMPVSSASALSALLRTALAYRTPDGRVRVLGPIREYMLKNQPPSVESAQRVYDHYFALANLLRKDGKSSPPDAIAAVTPEVANIDFIIRYALKHAQDIGPAVDAATCLCSLYSYAGVGTADLLPTALSSARAGGLLKPTADLLQCWAWLAYNSVVAGDPRALWEEALELYESLGDARGRIDTTTVMTMLLPPTEAIYACGHMRELAVGLEDNRRIAVCNQRQAVAYERAGKLDAARACHVDAVSTLESMGAMDDRMLGFGLRCIAELDFDAGDIASGIEMLQRALPALQLARYTTGMGEARLLLGSTLLKQGDAANAIEHLALARQDFHSVAAAQFELECLRYLVSAHLEMGNVGSAEDDVEASRVVLAASCEGEHRAYARCLLLHSQAEVALHHGSVEDAEAALSVALTVIREHDPAVSFEVMQQLEAELLELLGRVRRVEKATQDASICFITAALIYRARATQIRLVPALCRWADTLDCDAAGAMKGAMLLPLRRFGIRKKRGHA